MNVKSKIFKRKTGKSKNKWVIRIEYFDDLLGKKRYMERHAERKGDAIDECDKLINDIKKTHGQMQNGERMTFNQLADVAERNFYKEATIVEGRKVSGIRSYEKTKPHLNNLKKFFGRRLIRQITTESLTDYKLWRLKAISKRTGENIKISTVNRELSVMRRMMRFAYGKGWILKDVFFNAKVIESASGVERTRLLTLDEENRLLESCQGERQITYTRKWKGKEQEIKATVSVDNPHLKAMIILAIDSGMRRGEILKLRWKDIEFENNLVRIVGTHTKTQRERITPLSQRAKDELEKLKKITAGENPFPFADIKRSFATAKRIAGIEDLHFHDLRRTAITRWIQQGSPIAIAGKLAGHSQLQTTMKHYTATDVDIVREVAEKINSFHTKIKDDLQIKSEMVN